MAKEAAMCLLFLSFLIVFSSGTIVGFSYLTSAGTTFLQENKISQSQIQFFVSDHKILSTLTNSNVSVDLFLSETLVENFMTSKSSEVSSWIKAHLVRFLPHVDIRGIIISCGSECLGQNETPLVVTTLETIHSVLSKLQISREVKVSVSFPLSFLEKLNASYENDLSRILWFIKKINSYIMIEESIDGELSMGDHFVESVTKRAILAASILPCKDVPLVLTIKSLVIPSSMKLAQFNEAVSKYLEVSSQITKTVVVALYAEVHTTEDFALKEPKREDEEQSKVHIRRSLYEINDSPASVFPTNPTSLITPPDSPAIITVPSSNPVTVAPTNPATATTPPVTVPSSTPVPLSPTNPANSPVTVTTPVTSPITVPGAQPVTNPVNSYPPPSASVPITSSMPPPANTNAPATQGSQSWCVAKTGVPESSLQSALDYACGMSSVDCSQIQQGGSCYNPNSIQNHASFAFNSYYQKNPAPTSCDFGGTATLVSTNPSTGSCIFPSSGSSASANSTSGFGVPPSSFGSESPPDASNSEAAGMRPFLGCMVLVISLVISRLTVSQ